MIKLLRKISLFIIVSIIGYVILVIVWGEYMPSQLRVNLKSREGIDNLIVQKIKDIELLDSLDVLTIGSSHAYRSFDPRIWQEYGYQMFNLGTSSQTHIHTGLLLREYVPRVSPKLVVYEVYPDIFANDGIESNTIFLSYNICMDGMRDVVVRSRNIKSINEYIYAKYREWKYPNEVIPIVVDTMIEKYVGDGFVERIDSEYRQIANRGQSEILELQVEAFKENIKYLQSIDIPYVLVQAPVTSGELVLLDMSTIETLLAEEEHYVDFSYLPVLNDSLYFYDYHHLNQPGVEIFNPIFIEWLQAQNIEGL